MLITAAAFAATSHQLSIVGVILAASPELSSETTSASASAGSVATRCSADSASMSASMRPNLKVGRYIFMRQGAKVVFFGRFVSVLRTYAAFLAGTNRMHWTHFLIANATGAVVWRLSMVSEPYEASSVLTSLSTPVGIALVRSPLW